jgi:hypothetical protein
MTFRRMRTGSLRGMLTNTRKLRSGFPVALSIRPFAQLSRRRLKIWRIVYIRHFFALRRALVSFAASRSVHAICTNINESYTREICAFVVTCNKPLTSDARPDTLAFADPLWRTPVLATVHGTAPEGSTHVDRRILLPVSIHGVFLRS